MKKILPIFIVGFLVLSGLGAAALPTENSEYKKINVTFSQPVIKDKEQYITITINEANSYLMKQNKPMLPSYTHTFIFPFGTKIKNIICTPKNIEQKTIEKEIMPTPKPVLAGYKITTTNNKETQITSVYPETWYNYDIGTGLDGNTRNVFVTIKFYPIKYHPTDKTIEWAKEAEIKIEYETSKKLTTYNEKYNLVIITADYYKNNLEKLVTHKTERGVQTKLVTLSDIYTGKYFQVKGRDNVEQIKYFIKRAIDNWGITSVLLVGNSDDLPTRKTHVKVPGDQGDDKEIFVSDLYYADIYDKNGKFSSWDTNNNDVFAEISWSTTDDEMDLHPDVHLGRLPCNNKDEVKTVVNKIINYENDEAYTQSWFSSIIAVGGDSFIDSKYDPDGVLEGEIVNDAVIHIMDGFIPDRIWVSQGDLTTKGTLNNALNKGAGFVDFSGHGNTNVWATHPHENSLIWLPAGGYFNYDVMGLANGDRLPIVVTGACSVSKYDKDENCFSWSWIKNNEGGGIASFGATGLGYGYIAEYVTYGLIEKITIETFRAYKNGAITPGEMWTRAINRYMQNPGIENEADYKTILEYQLFGDPTLSISEDSLPPAQPSKPDGPTNGEINEEYVYTTSTTDPNDDQVYYLFDWGDGTYSGWLGPYNSGEEIYAIKTWTKEGDYEIRVKARDIHGVQSEWSDPLSVSMPRKKITYNPLLEKLYERFPTLFQLLKQLLQN